MLILFDVDGTLLRSRGVGLKSMKEAIEQLHEVSVDPRVLNTGGRLDNHLFRELLELGGLASDSATIGELSRAYVQRMKHHFSQDSWSNPLPGGRELVQAVHEDETLCGALLTGNIEETCWLKLEDAGYDRQWFEFGVYGNEGEHRRDLPVIAMQRYQTMHHRSIRPEDVVVIGDTPHDVDCARHSGCRSVGVATGMSSTEELLQSQASLVVDELTDLESLLGWVKDAR